MDEKIPDSIVRYIKGSHHYKSMFATKWTCIAIGRGEQECQKSLCLEASPLCIPFLHVYCWILRGVKIVTMRKYHMGLSSASNPNALHVMQTKQVSLKSQQYPQGGSSPISRICSILLGIRWVLHAFIWSFICWKHMRWRHTYMSPHVWGVPPIILLECKNNHNTIHEVC
jgi:hypothetical protein